MTIKGYLAAAQALLREINGHLAQRDESTCSPDDYVWVLDFMRLKVDEVSDFITLALEYLERKS